MAMMERTSAVSLVLPAIFSCSNVLLRTDMPSTASTSRNISAGKSDIPDWAVANEEGGSLCMAIKALDCVP